MKRKFIYSVVVFSRSNKSLSIKKAEFHTLKNARMAKTDLLKLVGSDSSVRIEKSLKPQRVFNQSTIYDFGA